MEINVQKGHSGRSTHPMQDGFGPHEHRRTGWLRRVGGARDFVDLGLQESGNFFT